MENKPLTVLIEDTKQKITQIINESNLPIYVVQSILKDFLSEVSALYEQQYQNDMLKWTQQQDKKEEVKNDD